jgi:imidazolonepropionase-like amidohydrolase
VKQRRTELAWRLFCAAAALAAAVSGSLLVGPAAASAAELLYFEVGTVWTGQGAPVTPGAVLVKEGKILHLGPPLKVAEKARRIAAPDAWIVPALTDAHSYLGTENEDERNETLRPIYPGFAIADSMDGAVLRAGTLLEEGMLRAYVSPGPRALVGGTGALVDLGTRRLGAGLMTLSVTEDALARDREPYAASGLALLLREKVPPIVAGRGCLRIFAEKPHEVATALAFARETKNRAVLVGVDRPELIPGLADPAEVIVVPRPSVAPGELARVARASEKGVRFAFASWAEDVWHVNLRFLASVAAAYGMPREAALRAVTVNAAEACGDPEGGTLRAGGRADFGVFAGDPLDLRHPLLFVVAGGRIRYTSDAGAKL